MSTQCQHHWVIDDNRGRTSFGTCRLCGSIKEFKNWLEREDLVAAAKKGRAMVARARERGAAVKAFLDESGMELPLPKEDNMSNRPRLTGGEAHRKHRDILQRLPQLQELMDLHGGIRQVVSDASGVSVGTLAKLCARGQLRDPRSKSRKSPEPRIDRLWTIPFADLEAAAEQENLHWPSWLSGLRLGLKLNQGGKA